MSLPENLRRPIFWLAFAVVGAIVVVVLLLTRSTNERIIWLSALGDGRAVLVTEETNADGLRYRDPLVTRVRLLDDALGVIWATELQGYMAYARAEEAAIVADSDRIYLVLDDGPIDTVVVSRSAKLLALDIATGAQSWATTLAPVGDSTFDPASWQRPFIAGQKIIIPAAEDEELSLQAFDPQTGDHLWSVRKEATKLRRSTTLETADGRIIARTYDRTAQVDAATGAIVRIDDLVVGCVVRGRPVALVDGQLTLLGRTADEAATPIGPRLAGELRRCGTYGDDLVVELGSNARGGGREWISLSPSGDIDWRLDRPGSDESVVSVSRVEPDSAPFSRGLSQYVLTIDETPSGLGRVVVDMASGAVVRDFNAIQKSVMLMRAGRFTIIHDFDGDRAIASYDSGSNKLIGSGAFSQPIVFPTSEAAAGTRLWVHGHDAAPFEELAIGVFDATTGRLRNAMGGLTFDPTPQAFVSGLE